MKQPRLPAIWHPDTYRTGLEDTPGAGLEGSLLLEFLLEKYSKKKSPGAFLLGSGLSSSNFSLIP
jgi:hypothetical protein